MGPKKGNLILKNKIKEIYQKSNLDDESLADLIGIDRSEVCGIKNGTINPSLLYAAKFAKVFKCKIEDIFYVVEEDKEVE